jgi:hypothetical protein
MGSVTLISSAARKDLREPSVPQFAATPKRFAHQPLYSAALTILPPMDPDLERQLADRSLRLVVWPDTRFVLTDLGARILSEHMGDPDHEADGPPSAPGRS